MSLFGIFKKNNPNKEQIQLVSYSTTSKDGHFMETIGYSERNTAEEFFSSLSQEELDKIKQHKTNEVVQLKKHVCAKCKKELSESETKWIAECCFCDICAFPRPAQKIINGIMSERKKVNAVICAISEMLSKQYYYITSGTIFRDKNLVFVLFLSRDKKTLLYIETTIMQDDIQLITDKTIKLPSEITDEALQKYILSNFGCEIKKADAELIIDRIESTIGYEYVPISRFEDLFVTEDDPWKKTTIVGYDKVTKKPHLIEKDFLRNSVSATLISLKKVAAYASKYAPNSKFVTITEDNWETFISVNIDMIDESTTFNDPLLIGNDYFSVMMLFKEKNGERFPLF